MIRHRRVHGSVALAAVFWLAACSGGSQPGDGAATSSPTAVSPSAASPSPAATFTAEELAPTGLAFDPEGRLYVADCQNGYIVRFEPSGEMTLVAGVGVANLVGALSGDGGPATEAEIDCPIGLAFDDEGSLLFADHANNRIRTIDASGIIETVAGNGPIGTSQSGELGGDGGPASEATLQEPVGLAFDATGNLFFSDRDNDAIREVDVNGTITTIAGTGELGFSGDGGPGAEAELAQPEGVTVDGAGDVLFADSANYRIRMIDPRGVITTIAGTGKTRLSGDGGPATEAGMQPDGVAFDANGALYIAEAANHVVRVIDGDGIITTVAGSGEEGCSGSGGPATDATLRSPTEVVFDAEGNLYISDEECGLLVVDASGIIEPFSP
jgi:trimeric autotransporter adhesin